MADDEGRALIDGLIAHAIQRQFVYTHRWRVHDLVMWDAGSVICNGLPFQAGHRALL
jgi:alpha-ketoglutarate-dependent 2,4-dichlorophenoxyacetate dioxygenase